MAQAIRADTAAWIRSQIFNFWRQKFCFNLQGISFFFFLFSFYLFTFSLNMKNDFDLAF
jgi:hypothetical protein